MLFHESDECHCDMCASITWNVSTRELRTEGRADGAGGLDDDTVLEIHTCCAARSTTLFVAG